MPLKNLPPLEVGCAYQAQEFEGFELMRDVLASIIGAPPTLRLHLKNATTIDLPVTENALRQLLFSLCDAFGEEAIAHLKSRNWI